MENSLDQLYELLPVVYRQRDKEQGEALRALLQVIAEQANLVEADIAQLYENWFIETCQDWAVPYIGDLVGYRIVHEAGEPGDVTIPGEQKRNKILIPRREVANTVRYRRRKGTLALLELLANDVAGWSARAVEFYKLLGWSQAVNHVRPQQGRTVDLRWGDTLDLLDGPFDKMAHTVDVRRINSQYTPGRYNIPSVGLFVWRLKSYPVTQTPAYCLEEVGAHCYTFSVLGNNIPLYTNSEPETTPTDIAGELNVPAPIHRRALEQDLKHDKPAYYGDDKQPKSLQIWRGVGKDKTRQRIPPENIIVADLSKWKYRPSDKDKVALDPVLGRLVFSPENPPKQGLWVSYHYGFSANMGGGEYSRPLSQPAGSVFYRVVEKPEVGQQEFDTINKALKCWTDEKPKPKHAVIEIDTSGVYVEQINVKLAPGQSLQIRAANKRRPIIRLLDWQTDKPDSLYVQGAPDSRFTLDGLLITGRGVQIEGQLDEVTIRHSTLVPGWTLHSNCEPKRPAEASLDLIQTQARVTIERSIAGSIQVIQDRVKTDPIPIHLSDTILDAASLEREAIYGPNWSLAHAALTILRSTVLGEIFTHAIDLAENSIFMSQVKVARRQRGCMRFCYITPDPERRLPRRYHCQPELAEKVIKEELELKHANSETLEKLSEPEKKKQIELAQRLEQEHVRPRFNSIQYGAPTYCQLAQSCAEEIKRGADDESEMGVFHHLFQPQRAANLRTRLDEYTPAEMNIGLIYAS